VSARDWQLEFLHDPMARFVVERIDEDEAAAQAATHSHWRVTTDPLGVHVEHDQPTPLGRVAEGLGRDMGVDGKPDAEHIARHDPARVLAECEAKRQILRNRPDTRGDEGSDGLAEDYWDEAVKSLASVYADHPDYRQEWKP
jgi:hypothetical protein